MQRCEAFNGHKQYPQIQIHKDFAVISKFWCRDIQFTAPIYANVLTTQPFTVLCEIHPSSLNKPHRPETRYVVLAQISDSDLSEHPSCLIRVIALRLVDS